LWRRKSAVSTVANQFALISRSLATMPAAGTPWPGPCRKSVTDRVVGHAKPLNAARSGRQQTKETTMITIRRHTAATLLVAVASAAATMLGSTATAHAAGDQFVAIAVGGAANTQYPVDMRGGMAAGTNQQQAIWAAQDNCTSNGGTHCYYEIGATNGCAAAASNDAGEVQGATGDMLRIAQVLALHKLSNQTGAHIVLSGCATPQPVGVRTFAGVAHIG
jgi:hypothetical protein